MAKKVKIGDIVEIPTKRGFAYAQYSHSHETPPKFGAILRILPGFFQVRPDEFQRLADQKEVYCTFFPLQSVVNRNIYSIVGHAEVPSHAKKFPLFRSGNINPNTRKIEQWWLWDGVKSWKVVKLTEEQMDLPIKEFPNNIAFIERLEQGWTPRKAEAYMQAARQHASIQKNPKIKSIRHFLLFKDENAAERAKAIVDGVGLTSEILDHGIGYSLIVTQGAPFTAEYCENMTVKLTEIANKTGGIYDAWETAL